MIIIFFIHSNLLIAITPFCFWHSNSYIYNFPIKLKDYRHTVMFRNSKIYSLHPCRDKLFINLGIIINILFFFVKIIYFGVTNLNLSISLSHHEISNYLQNHRTPTQNLSQYIASCNYATYIIHKHHLNVLIFEYSD